ncbi:MAG: FG-GAP repeat protein [Saprospiraceae bacterium]|nr:FG-GAP repeat protein [Saprospiraceae bacterium]
MVNQNAASSERFGASVAISVDNAIVGAWGDDEGAGLTDNGSHPYSREIQHLESGNTKSNWSIKMLLLVIILELV